MFWKILVQKLTCQWTLRVSHSRLCLIWRGPKTTVFHDAGAEVAVLCITKSGEVLNYQAFTNSRGIYTVAETMPESDRWDACLARPISSFHELCTHLSDGSSGVKFSYNRPSGYSHTIRAFVYRPVNVPTYCLWEFLDVCKFCSLNLYCVLILS